MAYLISDKRHGNEVYVTKEALNCGFFFFSLLETGMTDLLSSLLTTAVFVIWCVLPAYHWHFFQCCVWSCPLKKKTRTEVEAEVQQEESWAFSAFAGKPGVLAGETGATWVGCKPLLH